MKKKKEKEKKRKKELIWIWIWICHLHYGYNPPLIWQMYCNHRFSIILLLNKNLQIFLLGKDKNLLVSIYTSTTKVITN